MARVIEQTENIMEIIQARIYEMQHVHPNYNIIARAGMSVHLGVLKDDECVCKGGEGFHLLLTRKS